MSVDTALRDPKPFVDGTARITLPGDLLFAFDEDVLKPGAEPTLRQLAKLLAESAPTRAARRPRRHHRR